MARCKRFNMLTMVTELPLLMANGTFKHLDSMQDQELESFLSYLVRYCSEKRLDDPKSKPEWWGAEVDFFDDFYTGAAPLPYIKNKQMKLRRIITSCYDFHDARHLLCLSEKLAGRGAYGFEKNPNDTVTVYFPGTKIPLVVIPASNLDYDLSRVPGQLMNSGFRREVSTGPVKKASMISYDCRPVTINDSETDNDCMIIDGISTDDETIGAPQSGYSGSEENLSDFCKDDAGDLDKKKRDLQVFSIADCVDLTLDDDDEERRAICEAAKARFLEQLELTRLGTLPPDVQGSQTTKDHKRKSKFSLKKFSLDQVPFLVRIGLLPRRCMVTLHEITVRTGYIEKYTRNL